MKPRKPSFQEPQGHLYRIELTQLIDLEHPLAQLAAVVDWVRFDEAFSPLYDAGNGRPAIPTRLMVGLHYLKHLYQLSDEDVVAQWVENPYWQHLCGSKYFEHEMPIHPTSMTKWRGKIAAAGAEPLLAETIAAGLQLKIVKPQSLQRVVVDTTVQPKAVAYPTDAKLYDDMRRRLVRLARQEGLVLRQSYVRCGKRMLAAVGRSARGRHKAGIRKHTKKLKTYASCRSSNAQRLGNKRCGWRGRSTGSSAVMRTRFTACTPPRPNASPRASCASRLSLDTR